MNALMGLLILVAIISLVAKHPGGFLIALFILLVLAAVGESEAKQISNLSFSISSNVESNKI